MGTVAEDGVVKEGRAQAADRLQHMTTLHGVEGVLEVLVLCYKITGAGRKRVGRTCLEPHFQFFHLLLVVEIVGHHVGIYHLAGFVNYAKDKKN